MAIMRIFFAGASGVLGSRIIPLFVAGGHEVVGMTRSVEKVEAIRFLGAEPVVCDVFDLKTLEKAVLAFRPEVIFHELTDLPDDRLLLDEYKSSNSRIRREGTRNLVASSRSVSARVIAQSVAWNLPGDGGKAVGDLEKMVLGAQGVVLRYGQLYGPGTYYEHEPPLPPRIHVSEAALRTADSLSAPSGVILIVEQAT